MATTPPSSKAALLKSVIPASPHLDAAISQVVEQKPSTASTEVPADLLQKTRLANSLADISDGNASLIKRILDDPHVSTLRDVAFRYDTQVLRSLLRDSDSVTTNRVSLGSPKDSDTSIPTPSLASPKDAGTTSVAVQTIQRRLFYAEPSAVIHRMVADNQVSTMIKFGEHLPD
jgi:hypothetical protein